VCAYVRAKEVGWRWLYRSSSKGYSVCGGGGGGGSAIATKKAKKNAK